MALDIETQRIAMPGQVFVATSNANSEIAGVTVPITEKVIYLIPTPGIKEAHIGRYRIILSTVDGPVQHIFPPRVLDLTNQLAPVSVYKRTLKGIHRINAAFMTQETEGHPGIPKTRLLRLVVRNS